MHRVSILAWRVETSESDPFPPPHGKDSWTATDRQKEQPRGMSTFVGSKAWGRYTNLCRGIGSGDTCTFEISLGVLVIK